MRARYFLRPGGVSRLEGACCEYLVFFHVIARRGRRGSRFDNYFNDNELLR
jgi:hypothetical protein